MVSAFAARQLLVLGQVKVADKANEILAIPKLLDMLAIEGAIVTIDAMGCQRAIARKVLDKKADYIFALKGNQGRLRCSASRRASASPSCSPRSPRCRGSRSISSATLTWSHPCCRARSCCGWRAGRCFCGISAMRCAARCHGLC